VIVLGQDALQPDDVVRVARAPGGSEAGRVSLGAAARERMARSRAVVERALAEGRAVYGVTTGFGDLKGRRIPRDQVQQLQINLLRSHAAGVGAPAPRDVVRAMLLLRAASLARGHSGCRPLVVDALLALLDADVTPVVPLEGSVGASGDLAPLAHLALVLIGEGEAWLGAQRMPAALALRGAGLQPLTLEAKEGLALVNGTQLSTALTLLAWADGRRVWDAAVGAAALSTEVLLGSFQPARPEVQALRPYPGALETARRLLAFSQDSALVASHADCGRVQDAYSMRCVPQVLGASWDALEWVGGQLAVEIESVNDNPLVFPESGEVVSAGLFHAQPIGMAADLLKIAIAEVASISERRIDCLLVPARSGLPAALAASPGVESGYMMAQYTAAALVSENKVLAHPASVDSIPTSAGQEDHNSMGTIAARKARAVVENAAQVVGIALLTAAEGMDLHGGRPGKGSAAARVAVRHKVKPLAKDRPIYRDLETAAKLVKDGSAVAAVEKAIGPLGF
jgi:histidine ammonia-lyase